MLTICFCTSKKEPHFDWLFDSLALTTFRSTIVIIDKVLWEQEAERRAAVKWANKDRFEVIHESPKPTAWQGPSRKYKDDLWALCNARNTGIVVAPYSTSRILWVDDCSLVHSVTDHELAVGAIASSWNRVVQAEVIGGKLITSRVGKGKDPRRIKFRDGGKIPGGWLYGANTSYSIEDILKINGYDEVFDGQWGCEDNDRGVRLERAGIHCAFVPTVTQTLILDDTERLISVDTSTFTPSHDFTGGGSGSKQPVNMALLNATIRDEGRTWTRGNPFDLSELRSHYQKTGWHLAHPLALQRNIFLSQL